MVKPRQIESKQAMTTFDKFTAWATQPRLGSRVVNGFAGICYYFTLEVFLKQVETN
jgi:hypothetical protein